MQAEMDMKTEVGLHSHMLLHIHAFWWLTLVHLLCQVILRMLATTEARLMQSLDNRCEQMEVRIDPKYTSITCA